MGIEQWRRRGANSQATTEAGADIEPPTPQPVEPVSSQGSKDVLVAAPEPYDTMPWGELESVVSVCTACELSRSRRQTVFGVGNREADWMVVGEAPGAEEDRQGVPFVGRAGKLLDKMLAAIGLDRESVFVTNILKCRPPGNRDPKPEEMACCRAFLERQIELVGPKVILSVGRISSQNLLQRDVAVGRLRGSVHRFGPNGTPLVVTYHPAYLLRRPEEKWKAWEDLKLARGVLAPRESAT